MADIELPQLGESVTEGTITRWFKEVGDQVAEDEPLFEVSTDKVDSEVPSPASGYLLEILVPEGETVDVGTRLAVLGDAPGGDGDGAAAPAVEPAAAEAAPAAPAEPAPEPLPEPLPGSTPAPEPVTVVEPASSDTAEHLPEPLPESIPAEPAAAAPTPPAAPSTPAAPAPAAAPAESTGEAPLLSPVVRRMLEQAGVAPEAVSGTGIGGRITRGDVEEHLRSASPAAAPSPAPAPAPAPAAAPAPAPAPAPTAPARPQPPATARVAAAVAASVGTDAEVPLNKIRTITAEHMVRSQATSAHAYVSTEVDFERVDRVRRANKEQFRDEEGVSLTFLPFVARALVDALAEYPQVNGSMGDDASRLVVHGSVNLGIAVDLHHEGLIVPVVHEAQDQRLRALARNIADLADRARAKGLTADDITGGTVTITNVGSTGSTFLLPVINQPQVMILSTDGIKRRPVVVELPDGSESIAIHSVGNLTLGWDHRAFDGAYASEFLARVRDILETRDWDSEL